MRERASKCGIVVLALLVAALTPAAAQARRIAVLDFGVQSDNPSYKFLGKGFAEFLAVELAAVKGVTVIDREKRNAVLEEQAFALSGAAAISAGSRIGNLLSANFLLTGEVFDVLGQLAVTVKMVDVASGAVVVTRQADGPPKDYKLIVRDLARALGDSLGVAAGPPAAAAVAEVREEQAKEVLTAFSEAVDAVDRKDIGMAREKLKRAAAIDRTNRAVEYYLNKLFAASPKFNVELIYYAPSFNPGQLGFVEQDRFYLTGNTNLLRPPSISETYPNAPGDDAKSDFSWILTPGLYYNLGLAKAEVGYYRPLGQLWGVGAEITAGVVESLTRDRNYQIPSQPADSDVYLASSAMILGGRLSLGRRLNEQLGLGVSGFVFNSHTNLGGRDGEGDPRSDTLSGSATLGAYWRLPGDRLTLDSLVTVPFLQEVYIDADVKDYVAYRTAPYPVVWETTAILAFTEKRLFVSLKEVLEIHLSFGGDERRGVASRAIPAVEWWPLDFLSLRAGFEYDFLSLMDKTNNGYGVMGGFTFRFRSLDLDVNYTYMERALRFYPGFTAPDTPLLFQLSWNGALVKERAK